MDVKKLFQGIAAVIDDEVVRDDSGINKIIRIIEEDYEIECLKLSDRPEQSKVKALSEAAMVILDWKLDKGVDASEYEQQGDIPPIQLGSELAKENDSANVELINKLLEESLSPVFVFTDDKETAQQVLMENKVDIGGRVYVASKGELETKQQIQDCLEKWLSRNHEPYALKEWENIAKKAKHDFFRSFGRDRIEWADALWTRLREDDESDCQNMFGEYLTRCIVSQMDDFTFDSSVFNKENPTRADRDRILSKLVNIEKMKLSSDGSFPEHPHAGDLYYCEAEDNYLLNVRADCDTARSRDIKIYCIKGVPVPLEDLEPAKAVVIQDDKAYLKFKGQKPKIDRLTKNEYTGVNENLKGDLVPLERIKDIVAESGLNSDFLNCRLNMDPPVANIFGKLRSPGSTYYLPLKIDDKTIAIKFRFELMTEKYKKICKKPAGNPQQDKEQRVYQYYGRLLSPYINEIQQECAKWCFRIGTMPTPEEFYTEDGCEI